MTKIEKLLMVDDELRDMYLYDPMLHNTIKNIVLNDLDEHDSLIGLLKFFIKENKRLKGELKDYILRYGRINYK